MFFEVPHCTLGFASRTPTYTAYAEQVQSPCHSCAETLSAIWGAFGSINNCLAYPVTHFGNCARRVFNTLPRNPCVTPTLDCFASLAMTALVETIALLFRHCEERNDEAIQKKGCAVKSWLHSQAGFFWVRVATPLSPIRPVPLPSAKCVCPFPLNVDSRSASRAQRSPAAPTRI